VPTADNPADVASRGCTFDNLKTDSQWWNGPTWITQSEESWPPDRTVVGVNESVEYVTQLVSENHDVPVLSRAFIDPQCFSS